MKVSLDGLLENAASDLHNARAPGTAYMVRQLLGHLTELRDRTEQGDYTALDEFFTLYVLTGKEEYGRTLAGADSEAAHV
jgi:hypothetical protein